MPQNYPNPHQLSNTRVHMYLIFYPFWCGFDLFTAGQDVSKGRFPLRNARQSVFDCPIDQRPSIQPCVVLLNPTLAGLDAPTGRRETVQLPVWVEFFPCRFLAAVGAF